MVGRASDGGPTGSGASSIGLRQSSSPLTTWHLELSDYEVVVVVVKRLWWIAGVKLRMPSTWSEAAFGWVEVFAVMRSNQSLEVKVGSSDLRHSRGRQIDQLIETGQFVEFGHDCRPEPEVTFVPPRDAAERSVPPVLVPLRFNAVQSLHELIVVHAARRRAQPSARSRPTFGMSTPVVF